MANLYSGHAGTQGKPHETELAIKLNSLEIHEAPWIAPKFRHLQFGSLSRKPYKYQCTKISTALIPSSGRGSRGATCPTGVDTPTKSEAHRPASSSGFDDSEPNLRRSHQDKIEINRSELKNRKRGQQICSQQLYRETPQTKRATPRPLSPLSDNSVHLEARSKPNFVVDAGTGNDQEIPTLKNE